MTASPSGSGVETDEQHEPSLVGSDLGTTTSMLESSLRSLWTSTKDPISPAKRVCRRAGEGCPVLWVGDEITARLVPAHKVMETRG